VFFFKWCRHALMFHVQPPPVIRPQAALSERETLETEVISASPSITFSTARYVGVH